MQCPDEAQNLGRRNEVHPGCWLVEYEDVRLPDERARNQCPLLLSSGQQVQRLVGEVQNSNVLERLAGEVTVASSGPPAETDAVVTSHEHDIDDSERKIVIHLVTLRHVAEANVRSVRDRPEQWLQRSEDRAQNRRLPGAIRSDHPE